MAIRRSGGPRHATRPRLLSLPEVDLSAISAEGTVQAEELYEDALEALYAAVRQQKTISGVGYLHSILETQGATQVASPFTDTFAVEGKLRLGIRF